MGFVDGTNKYPSRFLDDASGNPTTTVNPKYTEWHKKDQTLLIWIFATLSDTVFPYMVGCRTVMAAWSILEIKFANISCAHTIQLKAQLQNTTKGERSVSDYLQAIQEIVDQLAAAGQPIVGEDLVLHMLRGLLSEYEDFATSIRVRSDAITAEDLHSLILSEEVTVNERVRSVTQPDSSPHVLYVSFFSKISGK